MRWQSFRQSMQYRLARFFYGRNGPDQLSAALLILSLLLSVAARPSGWFWLLPLSYVVLALCFYRILSRNVARRRAENARFTDKTRAIRAWFALRRRIFRERDLYRYLKCPGCHQRLRVPKGKGKIEITCNRCHHKMVKKV